MKTYTDLELWELAQTASREAARQLDEFPCNIYRLLQTLQTAMCAVQELECRGRGTQAKDDEK